MNCPKCNSERTNKNGTNRQGEQTYKCKDCKHYFKEGDEPIKPITQQQTQAAPEKSAGLSEKQLRAKYDLRFIVKTKCQDLKKGTFLSMGEFVKFCGIVPGVGYREVLMHPDYEPYRGRVRGEIYWSHPESIRSMKDEGILN